MRTFSRVSFVASLALAFVSLACSSDRKTTRLNNLPVDDDGDDTDDDTPSARGAEARAGPQGAVPGERPGKAARAAR